MGIDPWGDLEALGPPVGPPGPSDEVITTYGLEDAVPYASVTPVVRMYGFSMGHTDNDGDDGIWSMRSTVANYPYSVSTGIVSSTASNRFQYAAGPTGNQLTTNSEASRLAWWLGRGPVYNGDPMITSRISALDASSGQVGIEFSWPDMVTGVEGIQFNDLYFSAFPVVLYFEDYDRMSNSVFTNSGLAYTLNGIDLYINGSKYGTVKYKASTASSSGVNVYCIAVENYKITFSSAMAVKRVEFRLNYSNKGAHNLSRIVNGGVSIGLGNHEGSSVVQYNDSIILDAPGASGPGGEGGGGGTDMTETNGLISSIIEWLKNLLNAIIELPTNIAGAIHNLLIKLFIPDQVTLQYTIEAFQNLLYEHFGFVYQCFVILYTFFAEFYNAIAYGTVTAVKFPAIELTMDHHIYTILPAQTVKLTDNYVVQTLQPIAGTIVSLVCVLAFVSMASHMFEAVVGGKSYFDFIRGE